MGDAVTAALTCAVFAVGIAAVVRMARAIRCVQGKAECAGRKVDAVIAHNQMRSGIRPDQREQERRR